MSRELLVFSLNREYDNIFIETRKSDLRRQKSDPKQNSKQVKPVTRQPITDHLITTPRRGKPFTVSR